ncbi:MAG: hypothetical protein ACREPR_12345, partial [Brasilonema sp.]
LIQSMQKLDISNSPKNAKTIKDYIVVLLKQLLLDYQQTRAERQKLELWEEPKDFTILGVIEMFTTDIRGYASQVMNHDILENPQEIVENLQKLQIFNISYVAEWYFTAEDSYPLIKHYIEKLNYLRLLIIEYIMLYQ